ncbi:MAG: HlyC/CorC family transporter [Candidatus Kapabacteria bacterium]|nr:HlyC/CorC family transporter [Ignavibacteriota bacterium]MCW5883878.1 HlyC/CorC family transporter [Candidatus Kapabacteria bacterium]
MDISTEIGIYLVLLILINLKVALSRRALTKFKAYCDEHQIESKSLLNKSAIKISQNIKSYKVTFGLILIIVYLLTGYITGKLIAIEVFNFDINDFWGNFNANIFLIIFIILVVYPFMLFSNNILPRYVSGKVQYIIALWSVIPIQIIHFICYPVRLIVKLYDIIFGVFFENTQTNSDHNSEEEIRVIIEESTKAGNLELNESILIDNIFEFKDTVARQIMTPRKNIIALGDDWSENEILDTITGEGYSRYPVFSETLDNVTGILHAKDLVNLLINKELINIKDILRQVSFVKEEDYIDEILRDFQKNKIQMAVVLDEFGGTSGIITMEDILEEIVGEIHDEHDEVNKLLEFIGDNEFLADATAPIRDLNEILPQPLPASDDYESLGGLIINETEIIPEINTEIKFGNYVFIVVKRQKSRLEKIKIKYFPINES